MQGTSFTFVLSAQVAEACWAKILSPSTIKPADFILAMLHSEGRHFSLQAGFLCLPIPIAENGLLSSCSGL